MSTEIHNYLSMVLAQTFHSLLYHDHQIAAYRAHLRTFILTIVMANLTYVATYNIFFAYTCIDMPYKVTAYIYVCMYVLYPPNN